MNDSMVEYRRLIRLLKARRCELGFTQIDLCSRMGLTDNLINRWENFRHFPKGPLLIQWAQELGLSLDVGSGWQLLETAPRDEGVFLWFEGAVYPVLGHVYGSNPARAASQSARGVKFTHWMPSMEPPKKMKKRKGSNPVALKAPTRAEDAP